jgi:hypothetical protein
MTPNRVLTPEVVRNLQCQNNALRALRYMGHKTIAVALADEPKILIAAPGGKSNLPTPYGLLKRRTPEGYVVSTEVNGCRVEWMEARS